MVDNINELAILNARIYELENENSRLKELLDKAGIVYSSFSTVREVTNSAFDPNQGARILSEEINRSHARLFFSYFWGRLDVYSKRAQNKTTGKVGYYPQCDNFWRSGVCPKTAGEKLKCKDCNNRCWTKLGGTQIENHLRGSKEDSSDVIGIYPLFRTELVVCSFLILTTMTKMPKNWISPTPMTTGRARSMRCAQSDWKTASQCLSNVRVPEKARMSGCFLIPQ